VRERAIVGDEPPWRRRTQDLDLLMLEACRVPCDETVVVELLRRVGVRRPSSFRRLDLIEVAVALRPESHPPCGIQRRDVVTIGGSEVVAERYLATRAMTLREMAIQLVVSLPTNDVGIEGVMLGHRSRDGPRSGAEPFAAWTRVLARAVL